MIKPDECILIMGRRGCGKSFLAKRIQSIWPRRVIIDTLAEYKNEGELVNNFDDFAESLVELKEKKQKKFVVVYQFNVESDSQQDEFNEILRLCYYFGGIQVVIEEIQLHSNPHWIPKWLKNDLFVGRHKKLSLLFTSQRPGMVHKSIVSQCSHIFCGNLIDGNDINYVSTFLNQESRKLINLPDRRFLYFHRGKIEEISNDF
ncbi:MAG: hypothetical protein KGL39_33215 [Patescibacteria group bacterium]|nr:hypothetical protein [Patescibacteria group bacterium]